MKNISKCSILGLLASGATAMAQQPAVAESWHAHSFGEAIGYSLCFGALGIAMVIVGFKIFDKVITRVNLEEEILKGNVAAGILSAAVIIGIALIVAASIG